MKKFFGVLCLAMLVPLFSSCGVLPSLPNGASNDSPQDTGRPIKIETVQDFLNINKNLGARYILDADLDFTGVDNFKGIGDKDHPFTGMFNGGFHTLKNITNSKDSMLHFGIFNNIGGGDGTYVANLGIDNINITLNPYIETDDPELGHIESIEYTSGSYLVDTVSGDATISNNFIASGQVNNCDRVASFGGIVANVKENVNLKISNCINVGNIKCNFNVAGGIVGNSKSDKVVIEKCENQGKILSYINGSLVGGIIGGYKASKIIDCKSVEQLHASIIGGIAGELSDCDFDMELCKSSGTFPRADSNPTNYNFCGLIAFCGNRKDYYDTDNKDQNVLDKLRRNINISKCSSNEDYVSFKNDCFSTGFIKCRLVNLNISNCYAYFNDTGEIISTNSPLAHTFISSSLSYIYAKNCYVRFNYHVKQYFMFCSSNYDPLENIVIANPFVLAIQTKLENCFIYTNDLFDIDKSSIGLNQIICEKWDNEEWPSFLEECKSSTNTEITNCYYSNSKDMNVKYCTFIEKENVNGKFFENVLHFDPEFWVFGGQFPTLKI